MLMIRAIVRPEKSDAVLKALSSAGYVAATKMDVVGRGKQKGVVVGDIFYDEIPKELIFVGVEDHERDTVIDIIMNTARTGASGNFGDGKIFVHKIEQAYTISSGKPGL